jgi:hypothetical protein
MTTAKGNRFTRFSPAFARCVVLVCPQPPASGRCNRLGRACRRGASSVRPELVGIVAASLCVFGCFSFQADSSECRHALGTWEADSETEISETLVLNKESAGIPTIERWEAGSYDSRSHREWPVSWSCSDGAVTLTYDETTDILAIDSAPPGATVGVGTRVVEATMTIKRPVSKKSRLAFGFYRKFASAQR